MNKYLTNSVIAAFLATTSIAPQAFSAESCNETFDDMALVSGAKLADETKLSDEAMRTRQHMLQRVVGQDQLVEAIALAIDAAKNDDLRVPGRPAGIILVTGPTGAGKTRSVEAAAEAEFGNPRALIKIDCTEFQHSHEIAKLIGSPPGYLGHRETHPLLSQEVLNQFYTDDKKFSIVLFDEIEKSSDSLWKLLLGILDKATLTLGDNRKVDFSRTIVVMTSNAGSREANKQTKNQVGLERYVAGQDGNDQINSRKNEIYGEELRKTFSPEFLNRVPKIIIANPFSEKMARGTIDIQIRDLQRLVAHAGPILQVGNGAKNYILNSTRDGQGGWLQYGGRPIVQAIEREILAPVRNLISTKQAKDDDLITVVYNPSLKRLQFFVTPPKESEAAAMKNTKPVTPAPIKAPTTKVTLVKKT